LLLNFVIEFFPRKNYRYFVPDISLWVDLNMLCISSQLEIHTHTYICTYVCIHMSLCRYVIQDISLWVDLKYIAYTSLIPMALMEEKRNESCHLYESCHTCESWHLIVSWLEMHNIYLCIYTLTYVYIHIHIYVCMYTYVAMSLCYIWHLIVSWLEIHNIYLCIFTLTYVNIHIHIYICIHMSLCRYVVYGVATIGRLHKIIGLFSKRAL